MIVARSSETRREYHRQYNRAHRVKLNRQHARRRQDRIPRARLAAGESVEQYESRRGCVVCRICRAELKQLPEHIAHAHPGWSVTRYSAAFAGAPLVSARTRERIAKAGKGRRPASRAPTWPIAIRRVAGQSNAQIAAAFGLKPETVRKICARLGLRYGAYDLGMPVTMTRLREIYSAAGPDRRLFARQCDVPERVILDFGLHSARRWLTPRHGARIIRGRDQIVASVFAANGSGGARRWHVPSAAGTLAALVPGFSRSCATLRALLARTRSYLRRNPSAGIQEWGEWLCEAGDLRLFLPLAAELSTRIESSFAALRGQSPRLWEQVLAGRFGVSPSVVHHAAGRPPATPPDEIERFVLRSAPVPARKRGARGRPPTKAEFYGRMAALFQLERRSTPPPSRNQIYRDLARANDSRFSSGERLAADRMRLGIQNHLKKRVRVR